MANVTPQDLFGSNYASNSTTVTFTLADLLPAGELTAAEAAATTGNGAKVAYAVIKTLTEKMEPRPEADRPTRLTTFEGSYSTNTDDTVSRTYTQTFQFNVGDVADEPT